MYWRTHNLKQNLHDQWHGPARCLGRDRNGYWLIHNRIPILSSPSLLRRATQEEIDQSNVPELFNTLQGDLRGRRAGQLGFIDLRGQVYNPPLQEEVEQQENGTVDSSVQPSRNVRARTEETQGEHQQ